MPRSSRVIAFVTALTCAVLSVPVTARADWPSDPSVNVPVGTLGGVASSVQVLADGAGGTLVGWSDVVPADTTRQAFLQRLDPMGNASWGANGVNVSRCTQPGGIYAFNGSPMTVSDGRGGWITGWSDARGGYSTKLQRVDANGTLQWTAGGVTVAPGGLLGLVSDGAQGATVVAEDESAVIRAVRVGPSGTLLWPSPTVIGIPALPGNVVPDGSGGVILLAQVWNGTLAANLQRVDGTGALRWGPAGVYSSASSNWRFVMAADGEGGAIVSWSPNGPARMAQRFDSTGAEVWAHGGVPLSGGGPNTGGGVDTMITDGHGGAFLLLSTALIGAPDGGPIWVQHLGADGSRLWSSRGAPVDTSEECGSPMLASDGAGGVFVVYEDYGIGWPTGPASAIRAQWVSSDGVAHWGLTGAPVSVGSGAGERWNPVVVGDGAGGLTAAWLDARGGTATAGAKVYAQHVASSGAAGPAGVGTARAPLALALSAPWPQPARAADAVTFSVAQPSAGHVRLALFDPQGRHVRTLADGVHAAGGWTARWDGLDATGQRAGAGLYFARLETAGASVTRKVVRVP